MRQVYASDAEMNMPFAGAKLALFVGARLAVILRDDRADIPFPAHWDLPGGGREREETPLACALRETREELGLIVPERAVGWARGFETDADRFWFFVAHVPSSLARHVVFGDEGQHWALMEPATFLAHDRVVPQFQDRLRLYLEEREG